MPEIRSSHERQLLLSNIRKEQNDVEDRHRFSFLSENLFHTHHLEEILQQSSVQYEFVEALGRQEYEFMEEKRGKNMGERFAMAISPKYFDKIHVIELGLTTHLDVTGDIDGMKSQWLDLRRWLIDNKLIDGELDRNESGRKIEFRGTKLSDDTVVAIRTRPLFYSTTDITVGSQVVNAELAGFKRMVFSMPRLVCHMIAAKTNDEKLTSEAAMSMIEDMMMPNNTGHGSIDPIRTGYYLATRRVEGVE